jgi:hypothetical protein
MIEVTLAVEMLRGAQHNDHIFVGFLCSGARLLPKTAG